MKIAVLIPGWNWYGTNLVGASHAAIFAEMGHQVKLFALSDGDLLGIKAEFLKHLPGLPPWERPWRLVFNILPPPLHLPFIHRCINPLSNFEVVVAYDDPTCWLGYYAKKLYGVKYIFFAEGARPPQSWHLYEKAYLNLADYWMTKYSVSADIVATESHCASKALKQRLGIDGVVTGGIIDLCLFNPSASGKRVRDFYGIGDAPLVLYVDHLEPYKGVDILLDAFKLVLKSIPDARLIVIGKCYSSSYWERIQRRHNESVIIIDHVPHNELPAFYAASTIFATCATWEEGYSHTIVEAQACGKPVVAFKIEPHKEVIKDSETGLLIDRIGDAQEFASGMLRLLTAQSLADAMGRKAVDWASYLVNAAKRNIQKLIEKATLELPSHEVK